MTNGENIKRNFATTVSINIANVNRKLKSATAKHWIVIPLTFIITNRIEEKLCPRCEKFNEDWEHIWICEANEVEVSLLIKNSIYEYKLKLIEEKKQR